MARCNLKAESGSCPRTSRTSRRPDRRGQALVEFALILPLLLLLTLGVVDLARVFSGYIALTDGVREAALYAAEGTNNTKWCAAPGPDTIACPPGSDPAINESPDPDDTDNLAYQIKSPGLEVTEIVLHDPVCDPDPCAADSTVTISASYRMDFLTPVLSGLLGGDITVTAETTARILQ